MIEFTVQPIADIIETELWPLLVEHREELTTNKALMTLAPDVERYRQMEGAGILAALVVREAGQVIGYSINLVLPNLHYRHLVMASNDVLFVSKSHRAEVGDRLMAYTRAMVRARGARLMCWHAKPDTTLDRLMKIKVRRGAVRVQDTIYTEEL